MGKRGKVLITSLKGIGLIIALWIINTLIAFVPFSVESNVRHILWTWFIVDVLFIIVMVKLKQVDRWVPIPALIFVGILIGAYFIPLNSNIPDSALELNNLISEQNDCRYEYSKVLFFAIEEKYTSPIRQYLLEPWKVFLIKDFEYFWNLEEGSYSDSNIQGRIYRKLLFASGRFSEDEITIHQGFCTNSPHLLVKIIHPEVEIWADFWAVDNFEEYEFGMRTLRPCEDLIGTSY